MFCGTLEAAADARWMCENKISYLINLTGVSRIKIRSCPCSDAQYHSPIEYIPKFNSDSTYKEITTEFHKINDFIQEARSKNACILIFNNDGYNLCQAIAIQYMMDYYGGLMLHHISSLQMKVKVKVKISNEYLEVLTYWEKEIEKKNPRISNNKSLRSFSFKINRKLAQI
uniref:Dual specificity phosphatase catalytic domain-containing protein n=1 Tax=Panagrolaimus sp. PS1159 TaxID=55785 RepID=A0AC35G1F3_9BILA